MLDITIGNDDGNSRNRTEYTQHNHHNDDDVYNDDDRLQSTLSTSCCIASSFVGLPAAAAYRKHCTDDKRIPLLRRQQQQQQERRKPTPPYVKLQNRNYLCTFSRMAAKSSFIYFLLVLIVNLSRNTSAYQNLNESSTNSGKILQQQNESLNANYLHHPQQQQHLIHNVERTGTETNTHINASTKRNSYDDYHHEHLHQHLNDIDIFGSYNMPEEPIYTNEFAVYIPAGKSVADEIAAKYGFTNKGQIGALIDYYLYQHHRVSNSSIRLSRKYHSALKSEFEVKWLQQQHEKIRRKRDGPYQDILPTYSPYSVLRQPPNDYIIDPNSHLSF